MQPRNREKHFLVTKVIYGSAGEVAECWIEAVHSNREAAIDWQGLKNSAVWQPGWA